MFFTSNLTLLPLYYHSELPFIILVNNIRVYNVLSHDVNIKQRMYERRDIDFTKIWFDISGKLLKTLL